MNAANFRRKILETGALRETRIVPAAYRPAQVSAGRAPDGLRPEPGALNGRRRSAGSDGATPAPGPAPRRRRGRALRPGSCRPAPASRRDVRTGRHRPTAMACAGGSTGRRASRWLEARFRVAREGRRARQTRNNRNNIFRVSARVSGRQPRGAKPSWPLPALAMPGIHRPPRAQCGARQARRAMFQRSARFVIRTPAIRMRARRSHHALPPRTDP